MGEEEALLAVSGGMEALSRLVPLHLPKEQPVLISMLASLAAVSAGSRTQELAAKFALDMLGADETGTGRA